MTQSRIFTDPTYLRTIYDGLVSGSLHRDNTSALPAGLVGIYEEALPPESNVNKRKKFLEFFVVWALLKKEVSAAFDSFHSLFADFDFSGFNLLHSASVGGIELVRDEDSEAEAGNIYYSTHFIFKSGVLIGWLATNNEEHGFPFNYTETDLPCISPYLHISDPDNYKIGIRNLIETLS